LELPPKWERTLYLASRSREPGALTLLLDGCRHAHARVRQQALGMLQGASRGEADEHLLYALDDPESTVRVTAVRTLVARRSSGAPDLVKKIISDPGFLQREAAEQRTFLVAYGALAGPAAVPQLESMMMGTQGKGVFRVRAGGPNLGALIEVLTAEGYVIAQEYLRRAPEGDTRVVILDGRPLELEGKVCAVRRIPIGGEFRSNIHLGGRAIPADPSRALLRAASEIGELIASHGIWMAGVDLVGTKAVEVNVRSPGGLGRARPLGAGGVPGAAGITVAARRRGSSWRRW